jgi:hypothetical protein
MAEVAADRHLTGVVRGERDRPATVQAAAVVGWVSATVRAEVEEEAALGEWAELGERLGVELEVIYMEILILCSRGAAEVVVAEDFRGNPV